MALDEHIPMNTEFNFDQQQVLQTWFSGQFPTGAFAFSHGLEALVASGQVNTGKNFQEWLGEVLCFGTGRNDAILFRLASTAHGSDLAILNDYALATCTNATRLLETQAQAQAFARLMLDVYGLDLPGEIEWAMPVVAAAACRSHGLDLEASLSAYLTAFASNLVFAGVRLVPLGQSDGQRILSYHFRTIRTVIDCTRDLSLDDVGSDLWAADCGAMAQETMVTRMFRS